MNDSSAPVVTQVLDFWFGALNEHGLCENAVSARWWKKDPHFDAEIRKNFGPLYELLAKSVGTANRPVWARGPLGLTSAIVVLDQFSRNMFRDSGDMYAADHLARSLTFELLALGLHKSLPVPHRTFGYMPLMHSERMEDQALCLELFLSLVKELEASGGPSSPGANAARFNAEFAKKHLVIVERFGRFPHRNALLGRTSTPLEEQFLKEPGSSF